MIALRRPRSRSAGEGGKKRPERARSAVSGALSGLPPDPSHLIPGSFFLRGGRALLAARLVPGGSEWTHGGLILGRGQIIESAPDGARILDVQSLWDHDPVIVSDAPMQLWLAKGFYPPFLGAVLGAEFDKRQELCGKARYLRGIPHSEIDYLALLAPGLFADRVSSSRHLICSALIDRAYSWAEINLFDDGRQPGNVTPADLLRIAAFPL